KVFKVSVGRCSDGVVKNVNTLHRILNASYIRDGGEPYIVFVKRCKLVRRVPVCAFCSSAVGSTRDEVIRRSRIGNIPVTKVPLEGLYGTESAGYGGQVVKLCSLRTAYPRPIEIYNGWRADDHLVQFCVRTTLICGYGK